MPPLPTLYAKNAKNKITTWTASTSGSTVTFSYGLLGGKQTVTAYRAEGKNAGRANATSPEAQAESEALSAWRKKCDEGYFATEAEARTNVVMLPMLAHRYDKQSKKIRWPCYGQPKLNGLRCLAYKKDGSVFLKSRAAKFYTVPHIAEALNRLLSDGDTVDGELYIHGVPLQYINSFIKRYTGDDGLPRPEALEIGLFMYDAPRLGGVDLPFELRYSMLKSLLAGDGYACLKLTETVELETADDAAHYEKNCIERGFEGIMLRNKEALYRFNYRSYDLLKWKRFTDADFEVIDMRSRLYSVNGLEETIVDVCVCRNNLNDRTFEVVPMGNLMVKKDYWARREALIGTRLNVRFLERSVDGLPQGNPVGRYFRIDEDAPIIDESDKDWSSGKDEE